MGDSGLTDGEVAGVAIGAAIGGIVLLGVVGLILRSIMFKEAKPVFTCSRRRPRSPRPRPLLGTSIGTCSPYPRRRLPSERGGGAPPHSMHEHRHMLTHAPLIIPACQVKRRRRM